jgi:apolipoprotein N-acyltransferase
VVVAVIQGNVPRLGLDDAQQAKRVFNNHIEQTQELASDIAAGKVQKPELVVWPENAADGDPINNRAMFDNIQRVVDDINIPVLIGAAVRDGFIGPYNAGILWLPHDGPNQRYEKVHLVPFGEYIPNHSALQNLVSHFGIATNNYVPGARTGLIKHDGLTFGDVICFEVAYGDHVAQSIIGGAQFLTVQSNNATYAFTEQPTQQLQITRFRAIEHKRAVAVATTTGVSAIIDSSGSVIARSEEMKATHLVGRIDKNESLQIIDRWGSGWLLFVAVLLLIFGQRKDSSWKSTRAINSALVA